MSCSKLKSVVIFLKTLVMADKKNIRHQTDFIKRKRSRHRDLEEAKELVNKCGEGNIPERLKSCTRFV